MRLANERPLRPTKAIANGAAAWWTCSAGVGGLSHGFAQEGASTCAPASTSTPPAATPTSANNQARFVERSVEELTASDINPLFTEGQPRILVGCAPCQPFSTYSQNRADTKWRLLAEFGRLVRGAQPDVVSMENVPRLASFHGGKLFGDFLAMLQQEGYAVWSNVVDCADYGVPQTRKRLVVLASRVGGIELLPPTHPKEAHPTRPRRHLRFAARRRRRTRRGRSTALREPALPHKPRPHPSGQAGRFLGRLEPRAGRQVPPQTHWPLVSKRLRPDALGRAGAHDHHPMQRLRQRPASAIPIKIAPSRCGKRRCCRPFRGATSSSIPTQRWFVSVAARWIGNAVPVALARAVARSVARALEI